MRILFVLKWPLTRRNFERFGIAPFVEGGHEVIVLDVLKACHPKISYPAADMADDPRVEVHRVDRWADLADHRDLLASCDLVMFLIHSVRLANITFPLLRMMSRLSVPYLVMTPTQPTPVPTFEQLAAGEKVGQFWSRLRQITPWNSLLARIPPRWLGIAPAALAVMPSGLGVVGNALIGDTTIAIPTHTTDYEAYLGQRDQPRPEHGGNIAVFLDQYLPYHQDLRLIRHLTVTIEPQAYYANLRRVFDRVERELGLEVVIAAHPTADYAARPDLLGGRRTMVGKTLPLVADAKLVIGHYSTALGCAALLRRPVMLLKVKELYDLFPQSRATFDAFSTLLRTPLYALDKPESVAMDKLPDVDEAACAAYVAQHLRHPDATDQPRWPVVMAAVEAFQAARLGGKP